MRRTPTIFLPLVTACAAVALAPVPAAVGQMTPFYVRTDLGGQVTQDTRLLGFFGDPLAPGSTVKFDPGFRLGFAGGIRATEWFAGEIESGVMVNRISSISGASRVDDAFYSNVPLLLNARFEAPGSRSIVSPFLGGGLGMSVSTISVDRIDLGGTSFEGTMSAAVFAYQAFAGLRFRINDQMGLTVEYHYFANTDSSWEADVTSGTSSSKMKLAGTQTHAASIAFEFRF